jgi:hypothetical protein
MGRETLAAARENPAPGETSTSSRWSGKFEVTTNVVWQCFEYLRSVSIR